MIFNEMVHDVRISRIDGQHLPRHLRKRDFGDLGGRSVRPADMANFTDKTEFRGSSESLQLKSSASRAWTEHASHSSRRSPQASGNAAKEHGKKRESLARGNSSSRSRLHLDEHQSNSAES